MCNIESVVHGMRDSRYSNARNMICNEEYLPQFYVNCMISDHRHEQAIS